MTKPSGPVRLAHTRNCHGIKRGAGERPLDRRQPAAKQGANATRSLSDLLVRAAASTRGDTKSATTGSRDTS